MVRMIWDGVIAGRGDDAALVSGGARVADVIRLIERSKSLRAAADQFGLAPAATIAVLAFAALGDGDGGDAIGPPLVHAAPRSGLVGVISEPSLAALFPSTSHPSRLALTAGLFQVFDSWEASHTAAQEAEDQGERNVSAYWHGIAHRREPDPGNAAYWFRRVGRHPVYESLAEAARPVIDAAPAGGGDVAARLLPRGDWDPFAFIEFCGAARTPDAITLARRLQRLEMALLLQASIPA
jgi:hypothetical protein